MSVEKLAARHDIDTEIAEDVAEFADSFVALIHAVKRGPVATARRGQAQRRVVGERHRRLCNQRRPDPLQRAPAARRTRPGCLVYRNKAVSAFVRLVNARGAC